MLKARTESARWQVDVHAIGGAAGGWGRGAALWGLGNIGLVVQLVDVLLEGRVRSETACHRGGGGGDSKRQRGRKKATMEDIGRAFGHST